MKSYLKLIILSLLLLIVTLSLIAGKKILENYQPILPTSKSKIVLVYENSGGFAGVCDRLQIMRNGQYSYKDTCRINSDRYKSEGELDTNEITELNRLINQFGYLEYKWDDKMIDGFQGALKFYGSNLVNSNKNKDQIGTFANNIIDKIKQAGASIKDQTVCAGFKISLPVEWKIEEVKSPKTGPLEGITYEASINKRSFKILNVNNQPQLDIRCFQPMKIDETSHQIKERLSLGEAVEILKPTKELSDFKNTKFDTSTVDQKECAHFDQWDLPTVICNSPFGIGCGKAPEGIKVKDVFICPKDGDKSTGAFIYEIIKFHQNTTITESLLNKIFNSISF